MAPTSPYAAVRITHQSRHDFGSTRTRFDERVPLLEPAFAAELVVGGTSWSDVEAVVQDRLGPEGLVALTRLDQGALLSLSGEPLEATLYLVGNPLVARQLTRHRAAAALYAPFRVAVFSDAAGVHVSYDQPSTVLASLGSPAIDQIAAELDRKIAAAAEHACGAG